MKDESIKNLFQSLKTEISKMDDETEKSASLLRLEELAKSYEGEDKVVSSRDIAEVIKKTPPQPGIMSGFIMLDKILSGFTPHQVIVLSGITKHGKTSFAIELTIQMEQENPLWFPLEESATELITKFMERDQEVPLFFTPKQIKTNTLDWIESKIVESKAKYGTKVVFIDHLGFIVPRSDNEPMEIGRVMRHLKGLAKKWNIVIVLLAHLTKTEIDKHPNLEDLKGSSAIGQEADTVMFIWRETTKNRKTGEITITNITNISVQANRRTGKTGNIKMLYQDGRFREVDTRYAQEMFEAYQQEEGDIKNW